MKNAIETSDIGESKWYLLSQELFPLTLFSQVFPQSSIHLHTLQWGEERASPSQLYSLKLPGLSWHWVLGPSLGIGVFVEAFYTFTLGVPKRSEGRFWVEPTPSIHSGYTDQTQRLRRLDEEAGVKNASQFCGFGNLSWYHPRIRV